MSTIDELLRYMKKRDKSILITNNQLSDYELNVVVVKILSWLKLENKRSIWIAQGKKTSFKSLEVNIRYPWCANLYQLVENEKLFHDYFSIKEGKFDFADEVSEEEKIMAREKAYQNYNPLKHI